MTFALLAPVLKCLATYVLGSFVMWLIMRRKLKGAWLQYESMREAFANKHRQNQLLYVGQEKIWQAYQELVKAKYPNG